MRYGRIIKNNIYRKSIQIMFLAAEYVTRRKQQQQQIKKHLNKGTNQNEEKKEFCMKKHIKRKTDKQSQEVNITLNIIHTLYITI